MADAKKTTTKKAAPKLEKSLEQQLAEKRADYLELQKSHAAGELVNPRALTATRKDIARLMTKLNLQSTEAEANNNEGPARHAGQAGAK